MMILPHCPTAKFSLTTVNDNRFSDELYYDMCSQLNEAQCTLFNIMMTYMAKLLLNEVIELLLPTSFHIFVSGGAGVGKSILLKDFTDFMKHALR